MPEIEKKIEKTTATREKRNTVEMNCFKARSKRRRKKKHEEH